MRKIRISGPSITQKEIDFVSDAVKTAWYDEANKYNVRFEQSFARYLGVKHAISLPSCTSAIHLALQGLDIGPGDEVIVPEITWIATAAPITYLGATPVFADIDTETWCLSPQSLEACITPKTKAVIPVDLYGGTADWKSILAIAKKHNISVIEDAAQAIGAEYKGKKAGSFGDAGVFSFHGSKILTTGEGGMLVTNDKGLYERALFLRDHGRQPGDRFFYNTEVGFKYKMSSLQAALGFAQLTRIEELINKKRQIFEWYKQRLADKEQLQLNVEPQGTLNVFWMVTVIWPKELKLSKETVQERLFKKGIDTRPFFFPLSALPAFATVPKIKRAQKMNVHSYDCHSRGLNLPSALNLSEDDVDYVCKVLTKIVKECGAKCMR